MSCVLRIWTLNVTGPLPSVPSLLSFISLNLIAPPVIHIINLAFRIINLAFRLYISSLLKYLFYSVVSNIFWWFICLFISNRHGIVHGSEQINQYSCRWDNFLRIPFTRYWLRGLSTSYTDHVDLVYVCKSNPMETKSP